MDAATLPDHLPLAPVLAAVDRLQDDLVAAVSAAVRIPSVNRKYPGEDYDAVVGGEGRVARVLAALYQAAGCTVDLFAVEPGRENAVGMRRGTGGGRSLLFNGHVDVVPPGDPAAWTSGEPLSGRVDGDRIWGRGATDMKGGIVAQAFYHQPGGGGGGPRGVQGVAFVPAYMTTEYCCWYHPDDEPDQVRQEIEAHLARAAMLDPWLRQHPPTVEWKQNWPASQVDPAHPICQAVQAAHEVAAVGTRFAGRPPLRGFAAVEDTSFLNAGGVPAISYGPGDLRVAHAYDEYVLIDELATACRTYAVLALAWCGVAS